MRKKGAGQFLSRISASHADALVAGGYVGMTDDARAAAIGEQKQMAAQRVVSELIAHQPIQPIESFAHIDCVHAKIDAGSRAEAESLRRAQLPQ